jgi:hypothetical protein
MLNETDTQKLIMLRVSKLNTRIFRNNTGMGWVGEIMKKATGIITLRNPRPLHAGLCLGSSDLIGWTSVEITPDMVGKKIAVFTALEVKAQYKKASTEQLNFLGQVKNAGGIAAVVRTEKEAEYTITTFLK